MGQGAVVRLLRRGGSGESLLLQHGQGVLEAHAEPQWAHAWLGEVVPLLAFTVIDDRPHAIDCPVISEYPIFEHPVRRPAPRVFGRVGRAVCRGACRR